MSTFMQIKLENLPALQVIKVPQYEVLLAEMKETVIAAAPELASALSLESEPMTKVLRVCAYYRMLDQAELNDDVHGLLLAKATGADLGNLAAFWDVERLTVVPADPNALPPVPPVPAAMETDEALRSRTQLSLEGHSTAGLVGS